MLTVKQIETFYWVAKLGTVQRAADKLHITQSAATKRLQDVEAKSAARLFEGSGKKARLSAKGTRCSRCAKACWTVSSDWKPIRTPTGRWPACYTSV